MLLVAAASHARPDRSDDAGAGVTVPAIVLPNTEAPLWRVAGERGVEFFMPRPVLRVSSVLMAWNAVRCGGGVAMLPRSVVEADLRAGTLLCWGSFPDRTAELWVLHTSRRLRSAKVATFVDFICAAFGERQVAEPALIRSKDEAHADSGERRPV